MSIGGVATTLTHDAAGNVTRYTPASGDNTFIAYDGANQATRITLGTSLDAATPTARDDFWYGPDGDRYLRKETWQSGSTQNSRWVLYLQGGTFEEVRTPNDPTVDFYQKVQVTPTIQYRLTRTKAGATSFTYDYLHRDHLGSVDRVTNSTGALVHRISSDAFGARREGLWNSDLTSASLATLLADNSKMTGRGFTDHEHLDRTGIIHMNGRIYDPRIGRFLQPDPIVVDPADSQSYNRYSYVGNQPLAYTDPSGFAEQVVDGVTVTAARIISVAVPTANFSSGSASLPEGLAIYEDFIDGHHYDVIVKPYIDPNYVPPPVPSKKKAKPKGIVGASGGSGGSRVGFTDFLLNSTEHVAASFGADSWSLAFWNVFVGGFTDASNDALHGNYTAAAIGIGMSVVKPARALRVGDDVARGASAAESTLIRTNPRNLIPTQTRAEMSGSQVKRLTKDMKQNDFDQSQPVDARRNSLGRLEIQDGHHRTEAAIRAGIEEIPVRVSP